MPRISPERAVNDTLSSASIPSRFLQVSPEIVSLSSALTGIVLSILSSTFAPTIISVNELSVASFVSTVPIYSPFLKTATLSEISRTSLSLCVIMIMDFPSSRIFLKTSKSFLVSCGVRTAVGSSRIRISAPRYNVLIISTVCFSETDIS